MDRPLPPSSTPEQEVESMDRKEAQEVASSNIASSISSVPSRPAMSQTSTQSDDKEQTQLIGSTGSQEHVITAPIIGGVIPGTLGLVESREAEREEATPRLPSSPAEEVTGNQEEDDRKLVERECFPMGCCTTTMYDKGWLDIACGPAITIDIEYTSHNHEPRPGDHTPLLPNVLRVDIDAPVVLVRVFGCLARDLLGLKVSLIL